MAHLHNLDNVRNFTVHVRSEVVTYNLKRKKERKKERKKSYPAAAHVQNGHPRSITWRKNFRVVLCENPDCFVINVSDKTGN
jgi:hypothetical protein